MSLNLTRSRALYSLYSTHFICRVSLIQNKRQFTCKSALCHGIHKHNHDHNSISEIITNKGHLVNNDARKVTLLGLASNIVLSAGKGLSGWISNSQALMGDAVHQLGDTLSDFVTLITISMASKSADKRFPFGYRKFESLGTLTVSGFLGSAAFFITWQSGTNLARLLFNFHESSIMMQSSLKIVSPHLAMAVALGSVIIKEWIYRITTKVANETDSPVLHANAWHHRCDALTSLAALASISGSYYLNLLWLDPLGGLIVSSLILKPAWVMGKEAFLDLLDTTMTTCLQDSLKATILHQLNNYSTCTVKIGEIKGTSHNINIELIVSDLSKVSAEDITSLCDRIENAVKGNHKSVDFVRVHVQNND